jgi:nicotinamidase-related amidase
VIDADPYPWPFDGALDPRRLAVVVAGDQEAWAARSQDRAAIGAVIDDVTHAARAIGATVVHLRHGAPVARRSGLPPVPGTAPWLLIGPIGDDDVVVDAGGVDGFHASPLDEALRARGIDHLVFVGYGAEAAVDSTMRAANDRGYECLVLEDGVAPFDHHTGAHALSSVTMSGGIFGAVATSAALLAELPIALEVP